MMNLVGKYWVDGYGNRWDYNIFSESDAMALSLTLKSCNNCTNCRSCKYCNSCENCRGCGNCYCCDSCIESYYCNHCRECKWCSHISCCTAFEGDPNSYHMSQYDQVTFYWDKDKVQVVSSNKCLGNLDEFEQRVNKDCEEGEMRDTYIKQIAIVRILAKQAAE